MFDPLTPVVMMLNNYETLVEMTTVEARTMAGALIGAAEKAEGE